ncbi:hypothetical protein GobsT_46930 [Gemmata obscuriglobus]|nr:hypothetical protein GobsT_46930 [Gemmata obscuriglobus]VTS09212.1 unnamed protein product [Gemmata obscuriglobus UQM 2246]
MHARAAERTAHLHRHHRMSGASQISGRCQVQRRVRLAAVRGSGPHARRRASADARGTGAALRSITDSARRVAAHRGHPPRPPAAVSRARHPRAPRGAPPTRTAVSRCTTRHAHRKLAAVSRATHPRAPRGARRGARRAGFTHADHAPTTAARALMHGRVAERTAHLHRQGEVSTTTMADGGVRCSAGFGALTSAVPSHAPSTAHPRSPCHRCGRAEHHRPHAPCRGTPEATHHWTARRRAAPATHRHHAEHHRPDAPCPLAPPATPTATRGDEPRGPPAGHHAEPDTPAPPPRTTRPAPPPPRSCTRWWPNIKLTCTAMMQDAVRRS